MARPHPRPTNPRPLRTDAIWPTRLVTTWLVIAWLVIAWLGVTSIPAPSSFAEEVGEVEEVEQVEQVEGAQQLLEPMLDETLVEHLISHLAFGSCADQNLPQPIWDSIAALNPDLFLFLGDTVYADTEDMAKMADDYARLSAVPEFARFRASVPILAAWDDHDYGANDAGVDYPEKAPAEKLFLDFFKVPEASPRRHRPGVYGAWTFGPEGRRVQIILLDGRSFRSPLTTDPSPYRRYQPEFDPAKTLLGDEQWRWLGEQLEQPAEIRLIASGVRVLGYAQGFESWKNFPLELERLFQLIRQREAEGVILLSGDAHFASLKRSDGGVGYPLYDFTSSGLTHSRPASADRPSPLSIVRPYGGLNFGTLDIDWRGEDTVITLAARGLDGSIVFEHQIRLSELRLEREIVD